MTHIISLPVKKPIHSNIKLKCARNSPLLVSVTMEISVSSLTDLINLSGFLQANILEKKDAQNIGIKVLVPMEQDANSAIATLRTKQ